jgi:hypothetical protein
MPQPVEREQAVTARGSRAARGYRYRGAADMQPCRRCGFRHPRRMVALMARWYAVPAGVPCEGGYFYLCPRCYDRLVLAGEEQTGPLPAADAPDRPGRGTH